MIIRIGSVITIMFFGSVFGGYFGDVVFQCCFVVKLFLSDDAFSVFWGHTFS